jgi:hypothetical protein
MVSVQVGDQDHIRMRSIRRRNRTSDSPEMAQTSGQDGVEQDGGVAILPLAGAVPPPCECAHHRVACWPSPVELATAISFPESSRFSYRSVHDQIRVWPARKRPAGR